MTQSVTQVYTLAYKQSIMVLINVELVLDGKIDKVGIDKDLYGGAQGGIMFEEQSRWSLFTRVEVRGIKRIRFQVLFINVLTRGGQLWLLLRLSFVQPFLGRFYYKDQKWVELDADTDTHCLQSCICRSYNLLLDGELFKGFLPAKMVRKKESILGIRTISGIFQGISGSRFKLTLLYERDSV